MLILARRLGESILIGDQVTIRVLSVKGKHIRLGIVAPDDVAVHRKEIYISIKKEESEMQKSHKDLEERLERKTGITTKN